MEQLGVPLYVLVREVGPAFVVTLAGLGVLAWRRPPRRGLAVAALGLYLGAAALPYLWLGVQTAFGVGGETRVALAMIFAQPAVEAAGWLLLFCTIVLLMRPNDGGTTPARELGREEHTAAA